MKTGKLRLLRSHREKPLILDGAIGSLLQEYVHFLNDNLWTSGIVLSDPEKVKSLHEQYLIAGADVITTNTFRLGSTSGSVDLKLIQNIISAEMELLNELGDKYSFLVAGSNGPAEDCYQKERNISAAKLLHKHKQVIDTLWESGVDFILNETFSHLDEILLVSEYCSRNDIEFVVSLFLDNNGDLLSGENAEMVIGDIIQFQPAAVSVNCISIDVFTSLINPLKKFKYPFGFYLNCGLSDVHSENISCVMTPESYADSVKYYLKFEPLFIGSCCGSNPQHTRKLRMMIDELY